MYSSICSKSLLTKAARASWLAQLRKILSWGEAAKEKKLKNEFKMMSAHYIHDDDIFLQLPTLHIKEITKEVSCLACCFSPTSNFKQISVKLFLM